MLKRDAGSFSIATGISHSLSHTHTHNSPYTSKRFCVPPSPRVKTSALNHKSEFSELLCVELRLRGCSSPRLELDLMLNLGSGVLLLSCVTRRRRLLPLRVAPSPLAGSVRYGFQHRGPECETLTHKILQQEVQRSAFLVASRCTPPKNRLYFSLCFPRLILIPHECFTCNSLLVSVTCPAFIYNFFFFFILIL